MCTFLQVGKATRLIAYTGDLSRFQEEEQPEMVASFQQGGSIEKFDEIPEDAKRYYRNRGGSHRNCGRKAPYKDRALRAQGSGLTRATNANF